MGGGKQALVHIRWYEREQTRVGVQSVKSWAAEPGNVDPDDLFVSGNADEVLPNGSSLLYLNCINMEVDVDVIDLTGS